MLPITRTEVDFIIEERLRAGRFSNPENPLNVHSIGILPSGNNSKYPFSKHFFDIDNCEIGSYNMITGDGYLFTQPLQWTEHMLRKLNISFDLNPEDLKLLENGKPTHFKDGGHTYFSILLLN